MDIKQTKQQQFNIFLFIMYFLFNISYFIINVKYPIVTKNSIPLLNSFINSYPIFISSLFFFISTTLIFYTIYEISNKRFNDLFKSACLLFLLINPFSLKYILIPGDNLIYALSVFFILKNYLLLFNRNENNLVIFFFILLSICLISPYAIILMSQIILLDYFYNFFSNKDERKPLIHLFIIVSIAYFIQFYSLSKNMDIFSDNASSVYFSFIRNASSPWLAFMLVSTIGFTIWCFSKISRDNKISNIILYIILVIISCLSFSFNSFNFPFFILLLSTSFIDIKNISKKYAYTLVSILIVFSVSSFFSILNNYKIQMIFSDNVIGNISTKLDKNHTYYVINNITYSPIIANNFTYPDKYWNRFYLSNNTWNKISKTKNIVFIHHNQDFIVDKMGNDFYTWSKNDNKYYSIMHKNGFSYIFFKKS